MASNQLKPPMWAPGFNTGHPLAQGLIGLWPFWEGDGDKLMDVSGNGGRGGLSNMTPATAWVPGGLSFDGSNDVVNVPDSLAVRRPSSAVTMVVLANIMGTGEAWSCLAGKGETGPPYQSYGIGQNNATANVLRGNIAVNGALKSTGDVSVTYGGDSIFVFRWGGGQGTVAELSVWTNGALSDSGTIDTGAGFIHYTASPLRFAANESGASNLPCTIYQATVWDRCLTLPEVREYVADPWCLIRPPRTL